jgi:hypothetical protein
MYALVNGRFFESHQLFRQVLLTSVWEIFVNNQLDAQFFYMYVYFYSLHVSGNHVPIIRRINCINTTLVYVILYR